MASLWRRRPFDRRAIGTRQDMRKASLSYTSFGALRLAYTIRRNDKSGQPLLLDGTMLDLPKEPPPESETVEDLDKYRKKRTKVDDKATGGVRFDENVPTIEVPVEDPNVADVDPENLTVIETRYSDRIVALPPFARLRMVIQTTKNELTGEVSRPKVPKEARRGGQSP